MKALAKASADRYQTAGELAEALKKAATRAIEEAVPVEKEAMPVWQKVLLWAWGAVGGVVLLAVVGGLLLASQTRCDALRKCVAPVKLRKLETHWTDRKLA